MRMLPRTISLFGLFIASFFATAQPQIRFDRLSIKDGLSQSSINQIFQDSKGFIWLATQDGLNKYDGFRFQVYYHDPFDSTSLSDNYVHAIHEDALGFIWVGTDNGLNKFNPETEVFQRYQYHEGNESGLNDRSVWAIEETSDGALWIGTAGAGLNAFDVSKETFRHYQHKPNDLNTLTNDKIGCLFMDSEGILWIGTQGGGVSYFQNDRFIHLKHSSKLPNSLAGNFVWAITEDHQGRIWIGTDNGLTCYDKKSGVLTNFRNDPRQQNSLPNNTVRTIYEEVPGVLWIGTEGGGLSRFELREPLSNSLFTHYQHQYYISTSLSNNLVQYIIKDRSGSIWIGTNSGLNKFDPKKQSFVHYANIPNNSQSINDNTVWSIFEDRNGILWVGTREGLNRIDRTTNIYTAYGNITNSRIFRNNRSVLSILGGDDGQLWVGTVDGLYEAVFSNNRDRVTGFQPLNYNSAFFGKNIENRIYALFQDGDDLWVGTRQGLSKVNLKNGKYIFLQHDPAEPTSVSNNIIRTIYKDRKNTIWIGTESGLNRVVLNSDTTVKFKSYLHEYGNENTISNDLVLSIWDGGAGVLWLGTYGGGLNRFNMATESFTQYTEKEGLANNAVYSVLGDDDGNLWLSTNKGVSMYNPKAGQFKNFHENDGLQSNEFNIGAYHRNIAGELFFGGINGFNSFFPNTVETNENPPEIVLTNFRLFNKSVAWGKKSPLKTHIHSTKEIRLSYKQNNLSLEFAALHYTFPEQNQYQYKMVGLDEEWIDAGNQRVASYTNLYPGEYTFIVKGANSDGIWSTTVASVKIIIAPPFWGTWWFRILLALTLGGLVYLWIWARERGIRKQRDHLEEQVEHRTAEVIQQKEKIESQKIALEQEKEKVEKLLHNILPEETIEELKVRGKAQARHYRRTTVMFSDVKNFTKISENMKPQDLVAKLDSYFIKYDEIIEQYSIEKIKTIGDSYMCAGGLPIRNKSNPIDVVLAALEIQHYMDHVKKKQEKKGETPWEVRIGIHTGEVTAGVVGIKRFAYDIWGDTVNVANRMETSGEVGKVNISGKTYTHIKEIFDCTYRGKVDAKNKGEVDMYFVDSIKPELSINNEGVLPNEMFWEYVNLKIYSSINYKKAEKYVLKLLEDLPEDLTYHCIEHTKDVCEAVEWIAKAEKIVGESLFLLKTAALFHDAGFVKQYYDHEITSVKLMREALPKYGYSSEQINTIGKLIMTTQIPQQPENHLEEIICDADLDYLGRDDFEPISQNLKHEFIAYGVANDERHWDEIQVQFIGKHRYFTKTSRELRTGKKIQHLERINKRLENGNYAVKKGG